MIEDVLGDQPRGRRGAHPLEQRPRVLDDAVSRSAGKVDHFRLWLDGVLMTSQSALQGGNVLIQWDT